MIYELHITTEPDTDLDLWVAACQELDAKPLAIRLASGNPSNPLQVMTAGVHEGTDQSAANWMNRSVKYLMETGFPIKRVKLEVPLDKSAEYECDYYEAHVKCLLAPIEAEANRRLAEYEGWIASYNELSVEYDGFAKWYFTKRVPGDRDYRTAGRLLAESFASFNPIGTVRMEKETVLTDSFPGIDEGWA